MRYLVEAGSRYLELNPARTQQASAPTYDTTGDVKHATTFATEDDATAAGQEFRQRYPDWPVRVVRDWRVA